MLLDLYYDPRGENVSTDDKNFNVEEYIRLNYFIYQHAMFYELGVLSSMTCMRKAYLCL